MCSDTATVPLKLHCEVTNYPQEGWEVAGKLNASVLLNGGNRSAVMQRRDRRACMTSKVAD